jgi:hypothetical protein
VGEDRAASFWRSIAARAKKAFRTGERVVESTRVAQGAHRAKDDQPLESRALARQRIRQQQQARNNELLLNNKLARRRAWDEQRLKDE